MKPLSLGKPRPLSMPADTCIGVVDHYAKPWAQGRKGVYTHTHSLFSIYIYITLTSTVATMLLKNLNKYCLIWTHMLQY